MADPVHEITMPKLGESVTEGTVGRWLKEVGEAVAFDDPLFEVSTDKVDSEIPSPYDGVLLQILVPPGETVPVGTPLARIGPAGAAAVPGRRRRSRSRSTGAAAEEAAAAPTQAEEITMPKLGESVTEGTVGRWLKRVGDQVAFDDPLFEVSTDKVDSEIPSPYDGVLLEILVQEGQTVPVGTPLARIGATTAARDRAGGSPRQPPHCRPRVRRRTGYATAAGVPGAGAAGNGGGGKGRCPRWSAGSPPSTVSTSRSRRLRRRRADHARGRPGRRRGQAAAAVPPAAAPVAPAAARTPPPRRPAVAAAASTPAATGDRDEVAPLSRMRLITAERMVESRGLPRTCGPPSRSTWSGSSRCARSTRPRSARPRAPR